jgi:site-specific recombinase XerD
MEVCEAVEGYLLFKATHASPRTIKTDSVLFRQFCRWLGSRPVDEVTSEDFRGYLEYHTKRGLSPYTIRRHHAVLSALYSWLTSPDIALARSNPVVSVSPPRLPKRKAKALAKDDITAILKAADFATCKRRARALILFLLDTGARASEVANVKLSDVNWNSGKVKVTGKGNKERFVYVGQRALSALWLYVKEERPEPMMVGDDHLFLTDEGYSMDRHTLRYILRRLSARAGVKASPHQFRHSAAVEHLRHGMDLVSLQHLMGHESIEVTRGYLDALSDEDVAEAARRTSPTDNWRL